MPSNLSRRTEWNKVGSGFFVHVWIDSCGALKQYRYIRRDLLEYRHCIYLLLRYNCVYLGVTSASTNARVKIIEQVDGWLEPNYRMVLETYFFQINAIIFSWCISFSVQCPRHWKKSPTGVFQRKKQIQVSWSVSNWEGRIRQHFDLSVHVHLL